MPNHSDPVDMTGIQQFLSEHGDNSKPVISVTPGKKYEIQVNTLDHSYTETVETPDYSHVLRELAEIRDEYDALLLYAPENDPEAHRPYGGVLW